MQTHHDIKRAVELLGGPISAARRLGVSRPAIDQWVKGERKVPAKRCLQIEQELSGAVTRIQLRPFDWREYWPDLVDAKEPA